MTHDWYDFDKKNNMRINTFKTNNGLPSPRLINARFSTGFRFSGKRLSYEPEDEQVIDAEIVDEVAKAKEAIDGLKKQLKDFKEKADWEGYEWDTENILCGNGDCWAEWMQNNTSSHQIERNEEE